MRRYYPVNLLLKNKRCLVIGGGAVAERKAKRLVECGARVTVISPDVTPGLKAMKLKRKISISPRRVSVRDLRGAGLVVAATDDRDVNSTVSAHCLHNGILVNIVDSPTESNVILPSAVNRGDLTITISTDGISPSLSKKIRLDLEKTFGPEYAVLLRIIKRIRPRVSKKLKGMAAKKAFYKKVISDEMLHLLKRGKVGGAVKKIEELVSDA